MGQSWRIMQDTSACMAMASRWSLRWPHHIQCTQLQVSIQLMCTAHVLLYGENLACMHI
jgi:hypothetical protein